MPSKSDSPRAGNKIKATGPKTVILQSIATRPGQNSQRIHISIELQQLLLNIFKDTFSATFDSKYSEHVQQVKHHLYKRDFDHAFGTEDLRRVYAMRWSPIRALAYTNIFCNLSALTARLLSAFGAGVKNLDNSSTDKLQDAAGKRLAGKISRIVCVGGGAGAEIVALGGYLNHLSRLTLPTQSNILATGEQTERVSPLHVAVTAIDIAGWDSVVCDLHSSTTTAPLLAQYASANAKVANAPLIGPESLGLEFVKQDVLNMASERMPAVFADATLVTLMFTLNELYSTSMSATTNLLLSMTLILSPGALLLVVDSPGSYSTVRIGKTIDSGDESKKKRYPMQWLLDHTLLESAAIGSSKNASGEHQWEKLESRDSQWFRLSDELRYPVDLEDMRYQIHLYRRL
ncbi:hypothetical protein N7G274_009919 [Stereocaulon virgatum]|uniref:25S rRNA (Uridine(2843)-N(3))-methyltransferase n=1 Tax=Stereocaulon virgatum TaxID=373712 RepID=A0ABR3ZW83_9LECA